MSVNSTAKIWITLFIYSCANECRRSYHSDDHDFARLCGEGRAGWKHYTASADLTCHSLVEKNWNLFNHNKAATYQKQGYLQTSTLIYRLTFRLNKVKCRMILGLHKQYDRSRNNGSPSHQSYLDECQLSIPVKRTGCYLSNASYLVIKLHKMAMGKNTLENRTNTHTATGMW